MYKRIVGLITSLALIVFILPLNVSAADYAPTQTSGLNILGIKNETYESTPTFSNIYDIAKYCLNRVYNNVFVFNIKTDFEIKNGQTLQTCIGTYFPHYFTLSFSYYKNTNGTYNYEIKFDNMVGTPDDNRTFGEYDWEVDFAKTYVSQHPKGAKSDEAYCKEVHDYIKNLSSYGNHVSPVPDHTSKTQSAYCALCPTDLHPVCAGYARAFSLLCLYAGIDAPFWTGYDGEAHGWSMVYSNSITTPAGGPLMVDVTWDDTYSPDAACYKFFWVDMPTTRTVTSGIKEFMRYIHGIESEIEYDAATDTITGLTTDMQYSLNGSTTKTAVSAAVAATGLNLSSKIDAATKDYVVTVYDKLTKITLATFTIAPRAAAPAITTLTVDRNEGIKGFGNDYQYKYNNDTVWSVSPATNEFIPIKAGATSILVRKMGTVNGANITPASKSSTIKTPTTPAAPKVSINMKTAAFTGATEKMEYSIDAGENWNDVVLVNKVFAVIAEFEGKTLLFRVKSVMSSDNTSVVSLPSPITQVVVPTFTVTDENEDAWIIYDATGNEGLVGSNGIEISLDGGFTYKKTTSSKTNSNVFVKISADINKMNIEPALSTLYLRYRNPGVFIKAGNENNTYPTTPTVLGVNIIRGAAPDKTKISFDTGKLVTSETNKTAASYQVSVNKGSTWVSASTFTLSPVAKETSVYVRYVPVIANNKATTLASNYAIVTLPAAQTALKANQFVLDYSGITVTVSYNGSEKLEISHDGGITYSAMPSGSPYNIPFAIYNPRALDGNVKTVILVRTAAAKNGTEITKTPSAALKLTLAASPKAPTSAKLNLANYGLTGITDKMEYYITKESTLVGNESWTTATGKTMEYAGNVGSDALNFFVRVKATEKAPASAVHLAGTLSVKRSSAPAKPKFNGDKTLVTNVNSLMEYSVDNGVTWVSVTEKTIDSSSVSSILIRYKRITAANIPASENLKLTKS